MSMQKHLSSRYGLIVSQSYFSSLDPFMVMGFCLIGDSVGSLCCSLHYFNVFVLGSPSQMRFFYDLEVLLVFFSFLALALQSKRVSVFQIV